MFQISIKQLLIITHYIFPRRNFKFGPFVTIYLSLDKGLELLHGMNKAYFNSSHEAHKFFLLPNFVGLFFFCDGNKSYYFGKKILSNKIRYYGNNLTKIKVRNLDNNKLY